MLKKTFLFLLLFNSLQLFSQSISKDLLLGKLQYEHEENFIKVAKEHASKTTFLNREVYTAFVRMHEAAKADGIELKIVSGARNFEAQKAIWDYKWKLFEELEPLERSKKILEFSSMPSTSRHHWGTDVDLNNLENSYFEEGKGKAEYEWLLNNAYKFGFHQVYTSKESGRTGYEEEKWHWSYLPLAGTYLEIYNRIINYGDITDFQGAYLAAAQKMISAYVNGIAPAPVPPARIASLLQEDQETPE
ncbi:M15 family metallopeptidase [Salinimicrobium soli]|uniref:M15 family metallopeptidase n=1 Tax=Salinimicrobium soli TaxID=1254399 RepID=UPI003AAC5341